MKMLDFIKLDCKLFVTSMSHSIIANENFTGIKTIPKEKSIRQKTTDKNRQWLHWTEQDPYESHLWMALTQAINEVYQILAIKTMTFDSTLYGAQFWSELELIQSKRIDFVIGKKKKKK